MPDIVQAIYNEGIYHGEMDSHELEELAAFVRKRVLLDMAEEVNANNIEKGWHEEDRTFGDDVALLHSEVSEMLEEWRNRGDVGNSFKFTFGSDGAPLPHGPIHLPIDDAQAQEWIDAGIVPKPIGVSSEAADVLIRLLDTCHRYGIDLMAEYEQKMAYNRTGSHRHGGRTL